MPRRHNKADMSIQEQIESIKERICDNYCKYPGIYYGQIKDVDEAQKCMENAECFDCPLNQL